jgi:hypothetical protein
LRLTRLTTTQNVTETYDHPENQKHFCTSIACKAEFETKGHTNAHSLLHLHAKSYHQVTITFGCFVSCPYLKPKRTRARKKV